MQLLLQTLHRRDVDVSAVESAPEEQRQEMYNLFRSLCMTRSWGNARDVETIGDSVYRTVLRDCNDPNSRLKADPGLSWIVCAG